MMEVFKVTSRTLIFYFFITLIYRFMGKREVGELGIVDLIVSLLIAELAAIGIEKLDKSIFLSIIPIILLVVVQIGVARISLNNSKIRTLFDGKPSVIINRGKVNFKEMLQQRYNLDDLLVQLRDKGIKSIEEVDYAILESNGKLSVFEKDEENSEYPLAVILDGTIEEGTLRQIGKDKNWLNKLLKNENVELDNVFYGFYRDDKLFIIKNSELES